MKKVFLLIFFVSHLSGEYYSKNGFGIFLPDDRTQEFSENVLIFSNILENALKKEDLARFNIVFEGDEYRLDNERRTFYFPVENFEIKVACTFIKNAFDIPASGFLAEDYFGFPIETDEGVILSFYKNGFYWLEKTGKDFRRIFLKEPRIFLQMEFCGNRLFYKEANSIWMIDLTHGRNREVFSLPGKKISSYSVFEEKIFASIEDEEGFSIYRSDFNGESVLVSKIPSPAEKIFPSGQFLAVWMKEGERGNRLMFLKDGKTFADIHFKKTAYPIRGENGVFVFLPWKKEIHFYGENVSKTLFSGLQMEKIWDSYGEKFLVWGEKELNFFSDRFFPVKSRIHAERIKEILAEEKFHSFLPVSTKRFYILTRSDSLRRFKAVDVDEILSDEEFSMRLITEGRKKSLYLIGFFIVAVFLLKGVENARRRKKK